MTKYPLPVKPGVPDDFPEDLLQALSDLAWEHHYGRDTTYTTYVLLDIYSSYEEVGNAVTHAKQAWVEKR